VLARLNQAMHGWANYFRHAVAKNTFSMLDNFAWWRVIRMLRERHHWRWKDLRRRFTTPTRAVAADHGGPDRTAAHRGDPGYPVPLPRQQDPQPMSPQPRLTAGTVENPLR